MLSEVECLRIVYEILNGLELKSFVIKVSKVVLYFNKRFIYLLVLFLGKSSMHSGWNI